MNENFLLAGNDSPANRGCDAITRGTGEILAHHFPGSKITDAHFRTGNDAIATPFSPGSSVHVVQFPARWSYRWLIFELGMHACESLIPKVLYATMEEDIRRCTALLSVGGDNYSLDYGVPKRFVHMNRLAHNFGKPIVIWGASIGPFTTNPAFEKLIVSHLKNEVDLILVREKASRDYLGSLGISGNVERVGDPAFLLKATPCPINRLGFELPEHFITFSTGAMMAKYVTGGSGTRWALCCRETIIALTKKTGLPIVLVPHVEADHAFFQTIINGGGSTGNIHLLNRQLTAAEMKWVIGKSELLVGSRMHATIAAYSAGVPVLSLAYSIKAIGMNLEIYGHKDYLLYKDDISTASVLDKATHILRTGRGVREETLRGAKRQEVLALRAGEILKRYLLTCNKRDLSQ